MLGLKSLHRTFPNSNGQAVQQTRENEVIVEK